MPPWNRVAAIAAAVLSLTPLLAPAQDVGGETMPIAGTPVVSGSAKHLANLTPLGAGETDGHGRGFRVETQRQPRNHYDIEVRLPLEPGIEAGDVLFASFWARAVEVERYETGEGFTLFRVQRTAPPWERGLYREFSIGPAWKRYYLAERFEHDVPAGSAAAVLSAGYPAQTIEVAGVTVKNLGPDADVDALPAMTVDYLGSEPDAAWRRAAEARIERHRKADLVVEVRDGEGRPVEGVKVRVQQTRHAFDFGVAVSATWLAENWDTPDGERYRRTLTQWFNSAAIENALKWSWWERDPEVALRALRWLNEAGLRTHGHVLVWPGLEKFRVEDAEEVWAAAQDDPDVLRDRVAGHIESILTGTAGLVDVWDVVNEAYNQNEFLELLGEEAVAEWFKLADRYAPEATLIYNDFGLLGQSGNNRVKQAWVYDMLERSLERGAPIDAIGFQAHLGGGLTPPQRVLDILDRFAVLGLDLQITEYDLLVDDPELMERYTRDFYTAAFSHPSVTAIQGWNYWAGTPTWLPEGSWFDEDWSLLPVGRAYRALVLEQWRTHETLTTGVDGVATSRVYRGDYALTIEGGASSPRTLRVDPAGNDTVSIVLTRD